MLSGSSESVSRKRLLKNVRKRNKILKRHFNTIRESCAFFWLSVKEIVAFRNKKKTFFFTENETDFSIDLKTFIFSNSPFYDSSCLSYINPLAPEFPFKF